MNVVAAFSVDSTFQLRAEGMLVPQMLFLRHAIGKYLEEGKKTQNGRVGIAGVGEEKTVGFFHRASSAGKKIAAPGYQSGRLPQGPDPR